MLTTKGVPCKMRACKYPGCSNSFEVAFQQGARLYCHTCAPLAATDLLVRQRARYVPANQPRDYATRIYPDLICGNHLCAKTFTPTSARQLYCCRACYLRGHERQRFESVLRKHGAMK